MDSNHSDDNTESFAPEKEKGYNLLLALLLTLIFTLALFNAVWQFPRIINTFLRPIFPDYGLISPESAIVREIKFVGYVCFGVTVFLILIGYLTQRSKLTISGSVAFYIPIFGHFAGSMFFFAGIGIFRVIWIPFFDISILSINLLTLGDIILIPDILLRSLIDEFFKLLNQQSVAFLDIQIHPVAYLILYQVLGLAIFIFSTISWLYGKFSGKILLNFWIYKYSRHPQYLGLLLWSYGLLLEVRYIAYPFGGYIPLATFPWLIFACLLIGVSLQEEIKLHFNHPNEYLEYRKATPFMFPLPRQISTFLSKPIKLLLKKEWPETNREGILIWIVYSTGLILLSLLTVIFFNPLFSNYYH